MEQIEIIVTQPDVTPTSSTTALNQIASTKPRPNLELHFNALNDTNQATASNAKVKPSNRNGSRRNLASSDAVAAAAGNTSSSSNYNTPQTSSDESKRSLLPTSPSSSSLQLTKKTKIVPSSAANGTATASTNNNTLTPNRTHPPSNFPPNFSLFVLSVIVLHVLFSRISFVLAIFWFFIRFVFVSTCDRLLLMSCESVRILFVACFCMRLFIHTHTQSP